MCLGRAIPNDLSFRLYRLDGNGSSLAPVYSGTQTRIPQGELDMFKFILCLLLLGGVYFVAVGFLRTAGKFGWTENAGVSSR